MKAKRSVSYVISFFHAILCVWNSTNGFLGVSATFSTQILEAFIMVPDTRTPISCNVYPRPIFIFACEIGWNLRGYACVIRLSWTTDSTKRWKYSCVTLKCFTIRVSQSSYQRAKPATKREMTQFHSDEYVEFLSRITPSNMNSYVKEQHKCKSGILFLVILYQFRWCNRDIDNVGDDCPVFDGLFEYCSISAGGSMGMIIEFLCTNY